MQRVAPHRQLARSSSDRQEQEKNATRFLAFLLRIVARTRSPWRASAATAPPSLRCASSGMTRRGMQASAAQVHAVIDIDIQELDRRIEPPTCASAAARVAMQPVITHDLPGWSAFLFNFAWRACPRVRLQCVGSLK